MKHVDEPSLMQFGPAVVISPDGSHRVPAALWADFAAIVLLEPEPPLLAEWLQRIEAKLEVGPDHREAIAARPARAASASEARRRAILEQSMRASHLQAEMRDPELVAKIQAKEAALAVAREAEANPTGKTDRAKRKAAKVARSRVGSILAELAALRMEESDQNRLHGEAKDPILLAKSRGEEIEAREATTAEIARDQYGARILVRKEDDRGRVWHEPALVYGTGLRARRLTGIEHAHANGDLGASWRTSERLHKIGVDYREAYESGEGCSGGEGGGGGGSEPPAPQPRAAELSQALADFRKDLSPRQRSVLDGVCGEDRRVGEVARMMAAHLDTTKKALREGLERAAQSRAEAIERRKQMGAEPIGARVAAVNAVLARVRA